ncbi:hypothetical protein [Nitrososphaera viennensis]|nr:hypothetical protein [Nitrososphaera viennensis]UVS68667.1 hypothetical protein NWT39_12270 [Nitrososphaera viennensis]
MSSIRHNRTAMLSFVMVGVALASLFIFVASTHAFAQGGQGGEGAAGSGGNETAAPEVAPERLKFFDKHDPAHTWNETALSYFDSKGTELMCDKVYNGTIYYQINENLFKCDDFGLFIAGDEQAMTTNGKDGQDGQDGQDGKDGV